MKKQNTVPGLLGIILLVLAGSCQKESKTPDSNPGTSKTVSVLPEEPAAGSYQKLGWNPEGSTLSIRDDHSVQVFAPREWAYAGYDQEGRLLTAVPMVGKKISCTCNNKSGECRPFTASSPMGGSISGCAGECTDCTMKQSIVLENNPIDVSSGGYYAIAQATRVLKNGESIPAVFDALLELKAFQAELARFYQEAYRGRQVQHPVRSPDGIITAPKGHSLIGLSIMGRGLAVIVPDDYARQHLGYTAMSKTRCSCDEGSCKLNDKTVFGGGVVYCKGACKTCSLITEGLSSSGESYSFTLQSFAF